MNLRQIPRSLPLLLMILFSPLIGTAQDSNLPLTNASVVKLVKAGFKEKTLITIISARPARFDLSPDRMIELKRSGVSEKVILAMLARQEGTEFLDDSWGDGELLSSGSGTGSMRDNSRATNPDGSTTDIFGSSGGSRGSTKTRGANGGSSNDVVTSGSATVRILRPPTEAGGAAAKLEKTPSLNNDAVIELVEAGFSEGTIIRRIEQSPVDFDFAPEKIAELKKHRVTDKIVTAMKIAMGVDNATPTPNGTTRN
jgi:hypothetical protein